MNSNICAHLMRVNLKAALSAMQLVSNMRPLTRHFSYGVEIEAQAPEGLNKIDLLLKLQNGYKATEFSDATPALGGKIVTAQTQLSILPKAEPIFTTAPDSALLTVASKEYGATRLKLVWDSEKQRISFFLGNKKIEDAQKKGLFCNCKTREEFHSYVDRLYSGTQKIPAEFSYLENSSLGAIYVKSELINDEKTAWELTTSPLSYEQLSSFSDIALLMSHLKMKGTDSKTGVGTQVSLGFKRDLDIDPQKIPEIILDYLIESDRRWEESRILFPQTQESRIAPYDNNTYSTRLPPALKNRLLVLNSELKMGLKKELRAEELLQILQAEYAYEKGHSETSRIKKYMAQNIIEVLESLKDFNDKPLRLWGRLVEERSPDTELSQRRAFVSSESSRIYEVQEFSALSGMAEYYAAIFAQSIKNVLGRKP